MIHNHIKEKYKWIQEIMEEGFSLFEKNKTLENFNSACDHILVLIEDAFSCYIRTSYGTAVFLSITAIEETAKATVSIYRSQHRSGGPNKGKDPLFDHLSKHRLANLPTVFMGERLKKAIGKTRCDALSSEVDNGSLKTMREEALYFFNKNGKFFIPMNVVTKEKAKEVILLAIETFDDLLAGYTNHTEEISQRLDQVFDAV